MKLLFVFVLLFFGVSANKNFERIGNGITEYIKTGTISSEFEEAAKSYQLTHVFRDHMENVYDNAEVCYMCSLVFDLVVHELEEGMTKEDLMERILYLCTSLGVETERVCQGSVTQNIDIWLYIVNNYPGIKSERVCGSLFQNYGCATGDSFEWSITIPEGKPVQRALDEGAGNSYNILHLSDFHYDPNYKVGANADCGEPVCCQFDQTELASEDAACGYWSDYRLADIPWYTVEETVRQTKTQKYDYVYYTGDIIAHRVWQTSVDNNTKTISKIYSFLNESYDIPIFPVFGNHEPHPFNVWPDDKLEDESLSVKWLFKLAAEEWSQLIGQDVTETALKGGYYSVSPREGLRVIGLNSNVCYTDNYWLFFSDVDPFEQLQWLVGVLQKAEENNESVHILTHVPTGDASCLKVWSREYRRVIERFNSTITGQFNGHTHRDEFHVYFNGNSTDPIGVAFNGASVTPYDNSNPSYKIYSVDSSTYTLLDYEEWTFNLTLANSKPSETPEWYKLYSFVEAYGVDNLQPFEVGKVLYKMAEDHSLLDDYFRFYYRDGDAGIEGGCDETCKMNNLCDVARAQIGDNTQCDYFKDLYNQH